MKITKALIGSQVIFHGFDDQSRIADVIGVKRGYAQIQYTVYVSGQPLLVSGYINDPKRLAEVTCDWGCGSKQQHQNY